MELSTYSEFSAAIHQQVVAGAIPVNGTIEVTNRCPLTCSHCYNNLAMGDSAARSLELTTDQHRRIADEVAEMGCLWMLYSGGEIFARRDFLDIYEHAKRSGLLCTLFTNGILIDERIADRLVELPPFAIEITLYGRTRETYERLTRVPGSFDRCMRGIRLLKERGLPLKLKSVAVTINQHEMGDMQRFAEEELGLPFKFDGMINARIDCSHSPLNVRLRPTDMVRLDYEDPARRAQWATLLPDPAAPAMPASDQTYHCGGGVSAYAIDPEGKLSICVLSQQDTFDLRAGGFKDGWDGFMRETRAKKVTRPSKCTTCKLRGLCSNCAATAELENGDAETPVEYFCEVAHLRAQALGYEPPPHGDCAFCAGGDKHAQLLEGLAEIRRHEPVQRRRSLAMVDEPARAGCDSGGCGSCTSAVAEETP